MNLTVLTPREASIFACWCDTVVAPKDVLPPVQETDAVSFFDFWLAHAPRLNRAALRGLLYAAETAPRLLGFRKRLRALSERDRAKALEKIERANAPQLRQLAKLMKGVAFLSYYGDDGIMRRLGYDAEERVETGRALRIAEDRP
jgi:hypothetical protein